jgi:periplasmic protein TonB
MTFSLVLHGVAISLIFILSSSLAKPDKPIIIDFTVAEPSGPSAPPAPILQKKSETKVLAKTLPQTMPLKQKALHPAPAIETEGPVPIAAKPREPIPQPAGQPPPAATVGVPAVKFQAAGITAGDTVEQLSNRYRSENFAYIKKIIEDNLSYPRRAQQMGWSGRVVVSFDVAKNGHVQEIRIVNSSGHKLLDSNLVETIRKVEPFPKPPASVTLNIPISYKLR